MISAWECAVESAIAGRFFVVTVVVTKDVSHMMSVAVKKGSTLSFPLVYRVEVSGAEAQTPII
jgi:hypothetical protein